MWEILWYVMLVLYVLSCVGLITIVLLQKGKGSGFAGAFGMGAGSDTVFGPRMSRSLPQKLTHAAATVFLTLALLMSLISPRLNKGVAPETVVQGAAATDTGDLSALNDLGSAAGASQAATPAAPAPAPASEPAPAAPVPAPAPVSETPPAPAPAGN